MTLMLPRNSRALYESLMQQACFEGRRRHDDDDDTTTKNNVTYGIEEEENVQARLRILEIIVDGANRQAHIVCGCCTEIFNDDFAHR